MKRINAQQQACGYCGESFVPGEEILQDESPIFPEWESIRHELMFPYHRVCWCWDRIDHWLSVNAPLVFKRLGKGATNDEINLTEQRFRVSFPLDLRRSYRLHDGSGEATLFKEGTLLSLQRMRNLVDWSQRHAESVWDNIPVVATGGGDYCGVDCRDAVAESHGRFVWLLRHEIGGARTDIASGFQFYLERFANDLERGRFREQAFDTFVALVPTEE